MVSPEDAPQRIVRLNEENTGLSNQRTLLAWYRAAISSIALSVGVGKIVPSVATVSAELWNALGAVFALLAAVLVIAGMRSYRRMRLILYAIADDREHRDEPDPDGLFIVGIVIVLLAVGCGLLVALGH